MIIGAVMTIGAVVIIGAVMTVTRPRTPGGGRLSLDGAAGSTSAGLQRRKSFGSLDSKPLKQYRHDRTASTVFNDLQYPVAKH